MNKEFKLKKVKGITLISLVITIIVLIILASVAIYLSLSNNGIFVRAKEAKERTNKQEATDIINLKITTAQMNKYAEKQEMPTLKELSEILKEDEEISYVTEKSQIASIKYEVGENPTSIYTKLSEYPYEFEINSSLQLASINGIAIIANKQDVSNEKYKMLTDYITSSEWTKVTTLEELQKYSLFILSGYWDVDALNKGCSTTFTLDEIKKTRIDATGGTILTNYINVGIYYNEEEEALYMKSLGPHGCGALMGIK